jgi:fructokinase
MRRARDVGALVSFDMNLRPALWQAGADPVPFLWRTIELADMVKLSTEEMDYLAAHLGDEASVRARIFQGKTELLIVTHGADQIHWYAREAHGAAPAFKVKAVDTTAAGDAFVAGLLLCLAERGVEAGKFSDFATGALPDALRFAAACGAIAVTRRGAFAAMPSRDDVNKLLEEAR